MLFESANKRSHLPRQSIKLGLLVESAITANRANSNLQKSNVDGSGHNYWVDRRAGYSK
ncbi:hypothetical protein [Chlorogloea sp. CCALA 695]|uniref:hypothetical protein n=1 Tax=Chlorogloea sp. CCALA 695 TaxID=2107693 RepID=UPI001304CEA6|nr:hypothetical protein [Chlorogloea sp. CCALA 695]